MTVGVAIKLLEDLGFTFVNQVGSHMKYRKDSTSITIVKHRSNKELIHRKLEKQLKLLNGEITN